MEGSQKHSKEASPETQFTDLCDVYVPATERMGKKPGSEREVGDRECARLYFLKSLVMHHRVGHWQEVQTTFGAPHSNE